MLDSGALIAFERNDKHVRTLVELAWTHGTTLHVPAGALAQIWRDGARQARLARLMGSTAVEVVPLDRAEAKAVGALCGQSRQDDIVDASVVLVARRLGAKIVTSDPDDLRAVDPTVEIVRC